MSVPWPAGSTQNPATAQQTLVYLDQLGTWIDDRRRELTRLDQRMQAVGDVRATQDIAMTLTVWQAIKTRYDDLVRVWDSGRAGETQLKQLAVMTWANLNDMLTPGTTMSTGGGLSLNLPEACRMLEALVTQLGARFQLAPVPNETSARIANLRAQLDRIREQAGLDPPGQRRDADVAHLAAGVDDLVDRANRGADIGGILGPTEVRAAQLERDLIVGHAQRAALVQRVAQITQRRAGLIARERAVADLVRRAQAGVAPAPKYAVPHIEALGDIPAAPAAVDAYAARLEQAGAALEVVAKANEQALAHVAGLAARFEAAQARRPAGPDPLGDTLSGQIRDLLGHAPVQLGVAEPLIAAYEASGRPA